MLYIVDTNAIAYQISYQAVKENILDKELDNYVRYNLIYLLSGGWMNNPNVSKAKFLFAGDSKPYWRQAEFSKLGVDYKAKKGKDYKYKFYISLVNTLMESFLAKQNIYVLFKEGFEADDIAATTVALNHYDDEITLVTLDHDWIPLTHFKYVSWLSTKNTQIRKINHFNNMQWFRMHKMYSNKNFDKKTILDLWLYKSIYGDASDNIPVNKSNKDYLPLIDLLSPPKEYDLKLQTGIRKEIASYISRELPQLTHSAFIDKVRSPFNLALQYVEQ